MAEITPPLYMDVDGVYSGDEMGLIARDFIGEGVVEAGDLAVTESSPASLNVEVAAGACWVKGDTDANAQPTYRARSSSVVSLAITPDPTNPRKVLILAEVIDSLFAGVTKEWRLRALHGTPAVSPLDPATPASALVLARINVTAADASIIDSQIDDLRPRAQLGGLVQVNRSLIDPPTVQERALVTSLPSSPVDGEIIFYEFEEGTVWQFRYNSGSASAHKWEFIGGPPAYDLVQTQETRNANSYANMTTTGPDFVVPAGFDGDFILEYGARCWTDQIGGQALGSISPDGGTTTPVDTDAFQQQSGLTASENNIISVSVCREFNLTGGDTARLQYKRVAGAGTATYSRRWLRAIPVRVG